MRNSFSSSEPIYLLQSRENVIFPPASWRSPRVFKKRDLLQTIHDYTDHHFFFLGIGFCDHNSKGYQRMIVNKLISVLKQHTVFIQEIQKYGCCYTFVSIRKAMVLSDKVQQICRLLLQRGIKVFSSKTLIDSSYAPFKRVIFFIAEQRTVFSEFHAVDYFSAFLICQSVSFSGSFGARHILMIISIQ